MKAVNLIPAEDRRGAGGAAGRSGGAAYILLAALAALVLLVGVYAATGRQVNDRKAELARVERDAASAEARAQQLAAYTQFNELRVKRTQTVRSIAASRFDWAHGLHELARVMPSNAWLTSLRATVSPDVSVKGGGTANALRGALPNPAIEVLGCTTDQKSVARMLTRMRLIDGVQRVSLQSSQKTGTAGGAAAGGAGGDCTYGHSEYPQFNLVVFFDAVAPPAPAATPTTVPTATVQGASK
jgi:Tfp pilus assembly protein PilN